MNLSGHRIAASLGKAALKTHALQTLTRRPLTRPRARSVWSASDLSALSVRRGAASGSVSRRMRKSERGLSMNLPGHRIAACLGKSGAEDARTPNADAWSDDSAASAKRLECVRFIGTFRLARHGQRFMVPIRAEKREGLPVNRVAQPSYVFSAMVGMARCAVPARVLAGGTNIPATLAF